MTCHRKRCRTTSANGQFHRHRTQPAAEPTLVAAVVLGMGLLVFAGTGAVAYRGRRRIDQLE